MIATEAALYGVGTGSGAGASTQTTVCGCGQELDSTHRAHCPRCGCTLR